ncbi:MAG: hypothetical protein R3C24_01760 [Cyanobacteriota/Melainabacteria group bacterium]
MNTGQWCRSGQAETPGPYEDAMSTKSTGIFHTRISALMNLHRLLPSRVVHDVSELDISLNSKEGLFVGFRLASSYIKFEPTDGFRKLQATSLRGVAPGTVAIATGRKKSDRRY